MRVNRLSSQLPLILLILCLLLVTLVWFPIREPVSLYAYLILLVIGLSALLQQSRKDRLSFVPIRPSTIFLVGYFFYRAVSIIFAPLRELAFEAFYFDLFYLIVFLILLPLSHSERFLTVVENAILWLAGLFTLVNLVFILNWWFDWVGTSGSITSFPPSVFRLPGAFLSHPNIEAGFLNLAIPLALLRLVRSPRWKQRLGWSGILVAFGIVSIFASSRGGWISLAIGLLVIGSLLWASRFNTIGEMLRSTRKALKPRLLLRLVLVVVVILLLWTQIINPQSKHPSHAPLAQSRSKIWEVAVQIWQKSPIFGNGPGTFHYLSVAGAEIPPGFFISHAHSLPLQVAAETGLIGLFLIGAVLISGAITIFKIWRDAEHQVRTGLAVIVGILITVSSHALFDFLFEVPTYVLGVLLFFVSIESFNLSQPTFRISASHMSAIVAVGCFAFGILGTRLVLFSGEDNSALQAAEQEDWTLASERLCDVSQQRPSNTFFAFQCAQALGSAAASIDSPQLETRAIEIYRRTLQTDLYWAPHWANLAALEFSNGEEHQAIADMLIATNIASRNVSFAVNLGWMYEESDQADLAINAYRLALTLDPWLVRSTYFHGSTLRLSLLSESADLSFRSPAEELVFIAYQELDRKDLEAAQFYFQEALEVDPLNADANSGLALVLTSRKVNQNLANTYIRQSLFLAPDSSRVLDVAGTIAMQHGQIDQAIQYFLREYELLARQNSSHIYYASTYRRRFLAVDYVPQLLPEPVPESTLANFIWLSDQLELLGQPNRADQIRHLVESYL